MTTGYIDLPVEGGGGGSGTVTAVNVSGGTTGLTFSGGPVTSAGTITMAGVLGPANGGTGQTGFPTNTFIFSDAAQTLVGYGEWAIDPVTKFQNTNITYEPNNLSQFPIGFNHVINIEPLQASPNDGVQILAAYANLDNAGSGFDVGTAGDAAQLIVGGFTANNANGSAYGRLRHINLYSNLGNGTDPFSFEGLNGANVGVTTNANVTIDGSFQGYDFTLDIDPASIPTSNFSVSFLSDFSQIPVDLYGYQGLIIQPNIDTIKNNNNFTGINMNPVITDMEGNAGFQGINLGGQITNQSATGSYQGISVNPNIVNLTQNSTGINIGGQTTTGTADWTALNISDGSITTTGTVRGIQVNVAQDLTHKAIEAVGHCDLNVGFDVLSGQVQQYGHVIGGEIRIPNATSVTGTDVLANNMAFTVNTGNATSDWTAAGPVGLTTLGFVGQIIGDGDLIGAVNFCLNGYNPIVNGTIDRVNNFSALCIPNSGTGTITEGVLYYGDGPFGVSATSMWGLRIEDSTSAGIENFLTKLAIGTSNKKVSSANVILDLFDGHIHVDQTTAPTVAANANAGTGASAVLTDASDIAGKIELTMGSGSFSAGTQLTVTFDKTYAVAPVVVISATNQAAVSSVVHHEIHLDNITTTGFDIAFGVQENVAGTVYKWNYFVVGV